MRSEKFAKVWERKKGWEERHLLGFGNEIGEVYFLHWENEVEEEKLCWRDKRKGPCLMWVIFYVFWGGGLLLWIRGLF